jgi:probable F420-dependent oxidoreductase
MKRLLCRFITRNKIVATASFHLAGQTPMNFGVILPNYGPGMGRLPVLDTAHAAESLGFHSVWTTDHLAVGDAEAGPYSPLLEALTTLAFLAGSTGAIRLGISALVLPQRNPLEVAREIASLDVLSGGRVLLAVGIGWSQSEYANLGYAFKNRGARMDEAIQVLRTAWRGSPVITYSGKHYRFEKAAFGPGAIQSGGPPLWVAGNSPKALRRAAMLADGWHPVNLPPAEIERMLRVSKPLLGARPFSVAPRLSLTFEGSAEPTAGLHGNPAAILEQLQAYAQAGVSDVVVHFSGETQPARERAMRRFASEIFPAFKG